MDLDFLTALVNDPGIDAMVRANRVVLPGGATLEAVAIVRHQGHLRVVSRIGGNGPAGGSSSRFAILDAQGGIIERGLWGLAEVAGMLAISGWGEATVEPAANDHPALARRLRLILSERPPTSGPGSPR